jgi:hypothetical protein
MNLTGTRGKPGTVPGLPLKGLNVTADRYGEGWRLSDV